MATISGGGGGPAPNNDPRTGRNPYPRLTEAVKRELVQVLNPVFTHSDQKAILAALDIAIKEVYQGGGAGGSSNLQFTASGVGAVPRSLAAKIEEVYVSLLDFGADPTGVLPSDNALRKALDEGFRRIYAPQGTYRFDETILLNKTVTIEGDGRELTVFRSYVTGRNHGMVVIGEASLGRTNLVQLRNLQLRYMGTGQQVANGSNDCWSGVYIQRAYRFENFYVRGFTNDGMYFAPSDASEGATSVLGTISQAVFFGEMRHCWSKDNGRDGVRIRAGANANTFFNCQFDRNGGVGFHHMTDGYSTYGNVIISGQASYNKSYGYYFEAGTDVFASGLYAEHNGTPTNTDTDSYTNTNYDFFIGDNTSRSRIFLGTVYLGDYTHVRAPARGLNEGCGVFHGGLRLYGGPATAYRIPSRAGQVASVASANATAAAGATPTKAEFDAVVTLVNELKTTVNNLLTQLRNGNMLTP